MLRRIITALCRRPELLEVHYEYSDSVVRIRIVAHPNDAKSIVGGGGGHISALSKLARLLWAHVGCEAVQIMPVESTDHKELRNTKFKARKDWPAKELGELLLDLTEMVFPEASIELVKTPVNDITTHFTLNITPSQHEHPFRKFGGAIAVLWVPMSTKDGHYVYAGTGGKNGGGE